MNLVIFIGNSTVLELSDLRSSTGSPGVYINDATVTVTLNEMDGSEVQGQVWPTSMPFVANSNGKYRATLDDGISIVRGQRYRAQVDVDAGVGLQGQWEVELRAIRRTA